MSLIHLEIQNLRNIKHISASFSPSFNIIQGANGSGKTSLLEAIFLLSHRRSFRAHVIDKLIANTTSQLAVFGSITDLNGFNYRIGISKTMEKPLETKVNGQNLNTVSELSIILPLQLIHHECHYLLEGSPSLRRQFIDWGVFHVEHDFHRLWKRSQIALQQRNSLLRSGYVKDVELNAWNQELIVTGIHLDKMRQTYVAEFLGVFKQLQAILLRKYHIELVYYRGWRQDCELEQALLEKVPRDKELGYTSVGSHRADLKVLVDGVPAAQILSRGQQKLLACVMKVAQGLLLKALTNKQCIYLLDDLAAELDRFACRHVIDILTSINCQVFLTSIETTTIHGILEPLKKNCFVLEDGTLIQQESLTVE